SCPATDTDDNPDFPALYSYFHQLIKIRSKINAQFPEVVKARQVELKPFLSGRPAQLYFLWR
ncbi:hypothetical protein ACFLQY_05025, partial [Verrucomicrobiota bacterium]